MRISDWSSDVCSSDLGAFAFFDLSGGLKLAIWAQDDISYDTGLPKHPISSTAFTIGHNVLHRKEVDETMDAAQRAGAEIIKAPQDTFYGGYAGYFRDINGHLWEIVRSEEHTSELKSLMRISYAV